MVILIVCTVISDCLITDETDEAECDVFYQEVKPESKR